MGAAMLVVDVAAGDVSPRAQDSLFNPILIHYRPDEYRNRLAPGRALWNPGPTFKPFLIVGAQERSSAAIPFRCENSLWKKPVHHHPGRQ